ncbi:MAG: DUF362 domain-containing protein [Promethearchaeota archaeon]|jgi:uncharacterized protein (DUF362 family)
MNSKAVILEVEKNIEDSYLKALELLEMDEKIQGYNNDVLIKVGIYDHKTSAHTTVDLTKNLTKQFKNAKNVYLIESVNYKGSALERLQIWKDLFNDKVHPYDLSDITKSKIIEIARQEMKLPDILFKKSFFVSTHVLRNSQSASVIKNLFGLIPTRKKVQYHKTLKYVLVDLYKAIGGVDLAVIDGTYLFIIVSNDIVAADTVGAYLADLNLENVPIIQEAMKNGIGQGDLNKIDILGSGLEVVRRKIKDQIA